MNNSPKIDTKDLLSRVDIVDVIDARVPLTKSGVEWEACCPFHTEKSPSFKVNPTKQFYNCFGCGANGDAIKFVQDFDGVSFVDACKMLGADVPDNVSGQQAANRVKRESVRSDAVDESPWQPVTPVPENHAPPFAAHVKRGKPELMWRYLDQQGRLLGLIYRFKTSTGGKEVMPLTWCKNKETGKEEWRWMSFPEPRPLYGLDQLAAHPFKPVLIVEGEKCKDAAAQALPDYVAVSWPGGGKAVKKIDWSPLFGRHVVLWADCDAKHVPLTPDEVLSIVDDGTVRDLPLGRERTKRIKELSTLNAGALASAQSEKPLLAEIDQPGVKTMDQIAEILLANGSRVYWVKIPAPGEKPDGWDIADAIQDGNGDHLDAFLVNNIVQLDAKQESPAPSVESEPPAPASGGEGESQKGKPAKEKKPIDWGRYNYLLDHFVLIYGTDTCFDLQERMIIKVNHLRLAYGSDYVKMWLNSDNRRMILPDQLVFDPSGKTEYPQINLFDGLALKPKRGNIDPILELLAHLCEDSADNPETVKTIIDWALKWLAMPLQRPGTKMRSALVFHGPQGAGKNLFFEIVAKIYGRYALVVGQEQLEDKFNDWASQKLFLIGDEVVARQELYHQKNKLKAFITGETIQINTKMMPLRTEANHVNVVFLSNEHQPLALEDGDRRYFVVYTPPRRHDDLYKHVAACLDNGGAEAFYMYLRGYDLTGFTEFDIPPMTKAKRDLIELGLKPAERFIREWLGGYLPLPLQPCSAGQLYKAFRRWCALTGERFPPIQEQFSKSVKKTVDLIANKLPVKRVILDYKVVKLDDHVNGQRSARVWIPDGCSPPEGKTEGSWAAEAVKMFDETLKDFVGVEAKAS